MKINYQEVNNRRGFTLVETMTSLMILSISIMTIVMVLQGIRHQVNDNSTTEFYLYLNVLENHGFKMKRCYPQRLVLSKGRKQYNVKFAEQKIVMSTNRGGYLPVLNHVEAVNWQSHDGILISHVGMRNGKQFEGRSWFGDE